MLFDALAARPLAKAWASNSPAAGRSSPAGWARELTDVEPDIYAMRRQKDADELARLRKAIAGTGAMHARAREIIEPGVNELDVFSELQAAAVREYGEMLTGTGNDYASGERGGPPRNRKIEAGELYILDLGPAFRGYFADNTRVTAVGGKPTDEQLQAWQHILPVFEMVERDVKPGIELPHELSSEAHAWLNRIAVGIRAPPGARHRPLSARSPASESLLGRHVSSGRSVCRRAGAVWRRSAGRHPPGEQLPGDRDRRRIADAVSAGVVGSGRTLTPGLRRGNGPLDGETR